MIHDKSTYGVSELSAGRLGKRLIWAYSLKASPKLIKSHPIGHGSEIYDMYHKETPYHKYKNHQGYK